MNRLRDRCTCGSLAWRVTARTAPIVRCDSCGRMVEPTPTIDGHALRGIVAPLCLIAHQLEGVADPGIVEDLGRMVVQLAGLLEGNGAGTDETRAIVV